ncbi:MAG TPA: DUF1801 domain-containing protein [Anaeromyxobacteraceae bacterium]|nr:DUF1801 domain-containing protein [Anaeromyxobacteraceae bacterium]
MPSGSMPVDDLIAKTRDWRGAAIAKIRAIIHEADPEVVEGVKWRRPGNPNGVAVWEHNGIVCMGGILKERVRLTFYAGASLADWKGLFNAMLVGNKARAIDVYEGDGLNEGALKALIRAGVRHNLARAGPIKVRKRHPKTSRERSPARSTSVRVSRALGNAGGISKKPFSAGKRRPPHSR